MFFPEINVILPDTGTRKEFPSGAVRDVSVGKGRMDLVDIECLAVLFDNDPVLLHVRDFLHTKDPEHLVSAIRVFAHTHYDNLPTAMIEVSKHFECGALKYAQNNYKKGIDLHCYIDSALRHYMKFLRGDDDEPHDRAVLWNLMCGRWTFLHRPEVDTIDESYAN